MFRTLSYLTLLVFGLALVLPPASIAVARADAPEKPTAKDKKKKKKDAKTKEEEPKKNREPDVIFVPTPQEVVDKMLELAEVKKNDVVYDLGCGNGIIVVTAAKKYGVKAIGFDIDPQRIKDSRENVKTNKVEKQVQIKQQDIFTLDLSAANVITLYLLPELNVKLIPQLDKLKPGSRIVSHAFNMEGVTPDKVVSVKCKDGVERTVYLWTTPLKKEKK
jgi:precorrin-6B methylase 2